MTRFTISILAEAESSPLLRILACLGRHRIQVESFNSSACGADVCRHIIAVRAEPERVRRAMKQIGAGVGILEAGCYGEGETLERELALYKLPVDATTGGEALERIVRASRARLLVSGRDYLVIEKTGSEEDIEELYEKLEPFGVLEFVRSGRMAVIKPPSGGRSEPRAREPTLDRGL